MLVFLLIFTVVNMVMGFTSQYEPSTLVGCVFAFCSIEGGMLAWIKIFEKKDKGEK